MSARGFGYVPGPIDPTSGTSSALFGATVPDLLPRECLELRDFVRTIPNQGGTNSCVGQAIATAVDVRFRKLGIVRAKPSAMAIYKNARIRGKSSKKDALKDEGSSPQKALRSLREEGCPSELEVPFDESQVNVESSWGDLRAASNCFISNWYNVVQSGAHRPEAVAHAHAKGYPVVFATGVDQAMLNSRGPIDTVDVANEVGRHMLASLGYRTRPDGDLEFLIANSWGEGWGEHGYGWFHEALFANERATEAFSVIVVAP